MNRDNETKTERASCAKKLTAANKHEAKPELITDFVHARSEATEVPFLIQAA